MQKFRHKLEIKLPCMVKYPAVIDKEPLLT